MSPSHDTPSLLDAGCDLGTMGATPNTVVAMPVQIALWRVDGGDPQRLSFQHLDQEAHLEELLAKDISVLGLDIFVVGRQVVTAYGKKIDLVGMDVEGDLYVIELKRDRTPREVVAQVLDYGSWVQRLTHEEVAEIYATFKGGIALETGFDESFGGSLPETINQTHHLVIVASELDPSTERIVTYLRSSYEVPLNALFFRYFSDGEREYLARSWLVDPSETAAEAAKKPPAKGKEAWNGQDFYVAIGDGPHRRWTDMVKFGFISAGGGKWYSHTLAALFPGARVLACIPGTGYVGVGKVIDAVVPVAEFEVHTEQGVMSLLALPREAPEMGELADDPENSEHVVRVEWTKAVPKEQAIWEKGMFANQNSACKLRNRFTLERLVERFGLDE